MTADIDRALVLVDKIRAELERIAQRGVFTPTPIWKKNILAPVLDLRAELLAIEAEDARTRTSTSIRKRGAVVPNPIAAHTEDKILRGEL